MQILIPIAIVIVTVAAMEFIATISHKYIMHGWGWGWHRSHHVEHDDTFERNDLYAVLFAAPSIVMIYLGSQYQHPVLWVGTGMAVYGFLYFVVHDGLVHQRWPFRIVPRHPYLKRLVQAHRLHHAVRTREGCVSFGFLYAQPVSTLKDELRDRHGDRLRDISRETEPTLR